MDPGAQWIAALVGGVLSDDLFRHADCFARSDCAYTRRLLHAREAKGSEQFKETHGLSAFQPSAEEYCRFVLHPDRHRYALSARPGALIYSHRNDADGFPGKVQTGTSSYQAAKGHVHHQLAPG